MHKKIQKIYPTYTCPFCRNDIVSSKKTEVFYRSHWINGCNDCFALSINQLTMTDFQEKNISLDFAS